MKLTVIGCSGSMPSPTSAASCYLVEAGGTKVLLDLGSGAFGPLQSYLDPASLDAVVFSHLHPDHCADLSALDVWLRYGPGAPSGPIPLVGPEQLRTRIQEIAQLCEVTMAEAFTISTLTAGEPIQIGALTITPHPALHPVPAFSFTVVGPSDTHDGEARLAYTGDTDLCEGVATAAAGADLLLAESAFSREDEPRGIHLTGERAGELAHGSGANSLILTHLQPWADAEVITVGARSRYDGPITLATPGLTVTI